MSSERGGARSRRVTEGLWVQQGFSFYSKCDERMKEGFNQDGRKFPALGKGYPAVENRLAGPPWEQQATRAAAVAARLGDDSGVGKPHGNANCQQSFGCNL